ncbi:EAL domain-containing protein [Gracilibacillus sp. D59]|uniref:EAL domain-containing protein n=1 Tax=Gracilibacillus sp. D59 TaxID=3457434 RepID=UPI003FCE205F
MKNVTRITCTYVVVGLLWIFFSDFILEYFEWDSFFLFQVQTFKGFIFVLITAILLFYLIRKQTKLYEDEIETRKQAEKQALESLNENRRFIHLFDQVSSGLVITDPAKEDNPIIYVNKGFERMTGYPKDEVIGKNARFLQGSKTREENSHEIKEAISREEPIQIEIQNYKKNGECFWNELKITPIINQGQTFFVGIQNDVTEKKHQSILVGNQFNMVKKLLTISDKKVAFEEICKMIEEQTEYQCLIFRKDAEAEKLTPYATHSLPQAFIGELVDLPIQPGKAISGEAAYYNKTNIKNNLDQIENVKYRDLARRFNMKTVWSTPILTSYNEVAGVFTLYRNEVHMPSDREIKALETYAYVIGLVMENMNYQEKMKVNDYHYRLIAENTTDIIGLINENREVSYVSPSINQLIGEKDISSVSDFFEPSTNETIRQFINYLYHVSIEDTTELEVTDYQGNKRWLDVKGRKVTDENDETSILLISRDITARKQYQESLDKILYYDPVTHLPNKYKFRKVLEKTIHEQDAFHLMLVDFDQMKEVKGIYGMEAWEFVMTNMSGLLADHFQPMFISRSGEDEFSLIVKQSKEKLQQQIIALLHRLKDPWKYEKQEFMTTIYIGMVHFEKQKPDTMILQARESLQMAKSKGAESYHFFQQGNAEETNRVFHIKRHLFQAIDQNELQVHYQPQVDIKQEKVIGFEALIRWNNKHLGNVSPGEFIGIAEESGWIVPIGAHIMKQVFEDVVAWNQKGEYYHISINISYKQMSEQNFVNKVKKLLAETKCPTYQISFEITESLLLEDIELSINVLQDIRALGIGIEVDDFGIGYSSLSYLKKFPISALKIDRSFVIDVHQDPKNLAIVQAIMEMGHALGLQVITEGVEEIEQIKLLEDLGCQIFQGYWFSKPIAKEKIPSVIEHICDKKIAQMNA